MYSGPPEIFHQNTNKRFDFSKFEFNPKSKAFTLDPIRISYNDEKIIFRANAKDSLSTTIDLQFDQVDLAKVTPENSPPNSVRCEVISDIRFGLFSPRNDIITCLLILSSHCLFHSFTNSCYSV